MNLNKKIGLLLDNGLSPNLISLMNEGQVTTIYNRLVENKTETKEAVQTTQQTGYKTTISPGSKADLQIDGTVISSTPDKGITIQSTKAPVGTGEQTEGKEIKEKFESKAQQGLFWARCNKCKDDDCKWCKMAKEFSKSTSKKQYEKMPEKKHPKKTVKYKKKTNEEFTMANYFDKVASTYANNAMGKTINSLTKEQFVKKHINKIVENNLRPTMKKRDLLKLIESEIKRKKGLNEDFYVGNMDEEFDFMSDVETAPIRIKPKRKTEPDTAPEWSPDEDEPMFPNEDTESEPQARGRMSRFKMSGPGVLEPGIKEPKTKPKEPNTAPEWEPDFDEPMFPDEDTESEPQARGRKNILNRFKDDFERKMSRMDESTYRPIKYRKF
jgi:hypothetical protein